MISSSGVKRYIKYLVIYKRGLDSRNMHKNIKLGIASEIGSVIWEVEQLRTQCLEYYIQ